MATSSWQEKAFTAVEKAEKKRVPQVTAWGNQFHIRMSSPFKSLVRTAAEKRGISLVGYMRRAIARQVAADLELDFQHVVGLTPYPAAYGERLPDSAHLGITRREKRDGRVMHVQYCLPDDGTGFGDWS
jgi:hypothetical protein